MSRRRVAVVVGVLFLAATAAFVAADAFVSRTLDQPGLPAGASADTTALGAGALLALIDGLAVVAISLLLFPLLRSHGEALALGYVALRVAELAAILYYVATPLMLVTLGDGASDGTFDAMGSDHLAALLRSQHDAALVLIYLTTGAAGLLLTRLLYRSKLVPRPIALLGLVGYPVLFVGTALSMFGVGDVTEGAGMIAVVPGGLFEVILPVWLIARGLAPTESA